MAIIEFASKNKISSRTFVCKPNCLQTKEFVNQGIYVIHRLTCMHSEYMPKEVRNIDTQLII